MAIKNSLNLNQLHTLGGSLTDEELKKQAEEKRRAQIRALDELEAEAGISSGGSLPAPSGLKKQSSDSSSLYSSVGQLGVGKQNTLGISRKVINDSVAARKNVVSKNTGSSVQSIFDKLDQYNNRKNLTQQSKNSTQQNGSGAEVTSPITTEYGTTATNSGTRLLDNLERIERSKSLEDLRESGNLNKKSTAELEAQLASKNKAMREGIKGIEITGEAVAGGIGRGIGEIVDAVAASPIGWGIDRAEKAVNGESADSYGKYADDYLLSGETNMDVSAQRLQKLREKYPEVNSGAAKLAFDTVENTTRQVPRLLISAIPVVGKALASVTMFGTSSMSGYKEARENGASEDTARMYAILSGAIEAGGEELIGGVLGQGVGALDKYIFKVADKISSPVFKTAAKLGLSTLGEGAEEMIQSVLSTWAQRATYDPDAEIDFTEVAYEGLIGALSAGLMTAANPSGVIAKYNESYGEIALNNAKKELSFRTSDEVVGMIDDVYAVAVELGQEQQFKDALLAVYEKNYDLENKKTVKEKLTGLLPSKTDPDAEMYENFTDVFTGNISEESKKAVAEAAAKYGVGTSETRTSGGLFEVSEEKIAEGERLSKISGSKVVFFEDTDSGFNGYYENGTIYINKNAKNPLAVVLSHELTHSLEGTDAYDDLSYFVFNSLINSDSDIGQMIEDKIDGYALRGVELDEDGARREIVADYISENFMGSEAQIQSVVAKDRSLALKIREFFDRVLAKFGNEGAKTRVEEYNRIKEIRDLYKKALGERVESEDEGKYSFVGVTSDGIEVYETSNEVKSLSYKERMNRFMDLMRNEYAGRTAKFIVDGEVYYAQFDDADISKNIYGDNKSSKQGWRAKINTGADGNIFELVENAKYKSNSKEQGKKTFSHSGVESWDYFIKKVQIDGNVYNLLANVRKKSDGEYVYSITLNNDNKKTASPVAVFAQGNPASKVGDTVDNSISEKDSFVNRQFSFSENNSENEVRDEDILYERGVSDEDTAAELYRDEAMKNASDKIRNEILSSRANIQAGKRADNTFSDSDLELLEAMKADQESWLLDEENRKFYERAKEFEDQRAPLTEETMTVEEAKAKRKREQEERMAAYAEQQERDVRNSYTEEDLAEYEKSEKEHVKAIMRAVDKDYRRQLQEANERAKMLGEDISDAIKFTPKTEVERIRRKAGKITQAEYDGMPKKIRAVLNGVRGRIANGILYAADKIGYEVYNENGAAFITEALGYEADKSGSANFIPEVKEEANAIAEKLIESYVINGTVKRADIEDSLRELLTTLNIGMAETTVSTENSIVIIGSDIYDMFRRYGANINDQINTIRESADAFSYEGLKEGTKAVSEEEYDAQDKKVSDSIKGVRGKIASAIRAVTQKAGIELSFEDAKSAKEASTELAEKIVKKHALGTLTEESISGDIEEFLNKYATGEVSDKQKNTLMGRMREIVSRYSEDLNRYATIIREQAGENTLRSKKKENFELTEEEILDFKKRWNDYQKESRRLKQLEKRSVLTSAEKEVYEKLKTGEMSIDGVSESVRGRIGEMYEKFRELQALKRDVGSYRKEYGQWMFQKASDALGDITNWEDGKAFGEHVHTMERNIKKAAKDPKAARDVIKNYISPVYNASALATKLKNEMRGRVEALGLELKAKKGNSVSESEAVQFIGEAEDALRRISAQKERDSQKSIAETENINEPTVGGATAAEWQAAIDEFKAANPNMDWAKIDGAIEEFHKIYDELFDMMNSAYIKAGYEPIEYRRGYFPHFQENQKEATIKIGNFSTIIPLPGASLFLSPADYVADLPTNINGQTHKRRPGVKFNPNKLTRGSGNTVASVYDAVKGFDLYVETAANVIYLTDPIQNLRSLEDAIKYKTGDEGLKEEIIKTREDTTMSEEERRNRLDELESKGKYMLSNFLVNLTDYTNKIAGKQSAEDRGVEYTFGRDALNLANAVKGKYGGAVVGLNFSSALTNFIPIVQATANTPYRDLLRGLADAVKARDDFVDKSVFLTNRRGSDLLTESKFGKGANALFELVDNIASETVVRAKYYQLTKQGLSESDAREAADSYARGLMAGRSVGEMPTTFNAKNPLTGAFKQFQLEVSNTFQWMSQDLPEERKEAGKSIVAALLRMFAGMWVYNEINEAITGNRSALDPINMVNEIVGDITGYEMPNVIEALSDLASGREIDFTTEKADNFVSVFLNVLERVVSEQPFIGSQLGGGRIPVMSIYDSVTELGDTLEVLASDDYSGKYKLQEATDTALDLGQYLVTGGSQFRKSLQGVGAFVSGGRYRYNADGEKYLQYPVERNVGTAVQGLLFGRNSYRGAQEWADNNYSSLSVNATEAYEELIDGGLDKLEAYNVVYDVSKAKKTDEMSASEVKLDMIDQSEKLTGSERTTLYYYFVASDSEKETIDLCRENGDDGYSIFEYVKSQKGAAGISQKLENLAAADLSGDSKYEIYYFDYALDSEIDALDKLSGSAPTEDIVSTAIDLRLEKKSSGKRSALLSSSFTPYEQSTYYFTALASDSQKSKLAELIDGGISQVEYYYFLMNTLDVEGENRKEQITEYIDSTGMTDDEKDMLYIAAGYSESTLSKTPWHSGGIFSNSGGLFSYSGGLFSDNGGLFSYSGGLFSDNGGLFSDGSLFGDGGGLFG